MRTRSQPLSPGSSVSLETHRAPRRKKTLADSSTVKKAGVCGRKKLSKRAVAKRPSPSNEESGPVGSDQAQGEPAASAFADQVSIENTQCEPSIPFSSNLQDTTEDHSLSAIPSASEISDQDDILPAHEVFPNSPVSSSNQDDSTGFALQETLQPIGLSSINAPGIATVLHESELNAVDSSFPGVSDEADSPSAFRRGETVVNHPITVQASDSSQSTLGLSENVTAVSPADLGYLPDAEDLFQSPQARAQVTQGALQPTFDFERQSHEGQYRQSYPLPRRRSRLAPQPVNIMSPIAEEVEQNPPNRASSGIHSGSPLDSDVFSLSSPLTIGANSSLDSSSEAESHAGPSSHREGLSEIHSGPPLDSNVFSYSSPFNVGANSLDLPLQAERHAGLSSPEEGHYGSRLPIPRQDDVTPRSSRLGSNPPIFHLPFPRHHGQSPRCPCCAAILQCPNGHSFGPDMDQPKVSNNDPLTSEVASKKRTAEELNDSDTSTPPKKHRIVDSPGSTPYPRRIPNRGIPYSERRRRRLAESQGRIHSTLFRLPELVAQAEADARLRNEAGTTNGGEQRPIGDSNEQPTSAPETPRSGWGIRSILSAVPFSFSSLFPTLGRPRFGPSPIAQIDRPEPAPISGLSPDGAMDHATGSPPAATHGPPVTPEKAKTLSPQDLSFSLFPTPINRNTLLRDTPKSPKVKPKSKGTQTQEKPPEQTGTLPRKTDDSNGANPSTPKKHKHKKRPPSPDVIPNPPGVSYGLDYRYFTFSSEDDSSKSDEEPSTPSPKVPAKTEPLVRGILKTPRPVKRVRFDASPIDAPSKLRTRATEPYSGSHFVGVKSRFAPQDNTLSGPSIPAAHPPVRVDDLPEPPPEPRPFRPNLSGTFTLDYDAFSSDSESELIPKEAAHAEPEMSDVAKGKYPTASIEEPRDKAIPRPQDGFSSSAFAPAQPSHPASALNTRAPHLEPETSDVAKGQCRGTCVEEPEDELTLYPQDTAPVQPSLPATLETETAHIGPEMSDVAKGKRRATCVEEPKVSVPEQIFPPVSVLDSRADELRADKSSLVPDFKYSAKVLSQASGFCASECYSSPSITPSSSATPPDQEELKALFGDDEPGRDALWLYNSCPTGDFSTMSWPEHCSYIDSLGIDPKAVALLNSIWDLQDLGKEYAAYCRDIEEFTDDYYART